MVRAEDFEDLQHRLTRAVVFEIAVAFDDVEKFVKRLFVLLRARQRLGQLEARRQIIRACFNLLAQRA